MPHAPTLSHNLIFRLDDLRDPRIEQFLQAHLQDMRRISPPESVHALDLKGLRQAGIRFWTGWMGDGAHLVCTGALKRLDARHAELKSMRTAESHRGQGIARRLLAHLLDDARSQGYERLSLETGSQPFFAPAHALYLGQGFTECGPFGGYRVDPNSRFMARAL